MPARPTKSRSRQFRRLFYRPIHSTTAAKNNLYLIAKANNLFAEDRILLKTAGLALCRRCALYVPIAQPKFAHRAQVSATREKHSAEQAAEQPADTAKRRCRCFCVRLRDG